MNNNISPAMPDRTRLKQVTKIRLWAGYIFILLIIIFANPPAILIPFGMIFIITGILIRMAATSELIKDTQLCTSGLYSVTRNPLYLGSFLIGLGFTIISGLSWFLFAFLVVLIPLYSHAIKLEENYLSLLFHGSYDEYKKSTPRFIPSIIKFYRAFPRRFDFAKIRRSGELASAILIFTTATLVLVLHRSWL